MSIVKKFLRAIEGNPNAKFWIISLSVHAVVLMTVGSMVVCERYEPSVGRKEFFYAHSMLEGTKYQDEIQPVYPNDSLSSLPEPKVEEEMVQSSPQNSGMAVSPMVSTVTPDVVKNHGGFTFFGLQTPGQRIVFVVDVSGSMLCKEGGRTRLEIANEEINQAVRKLAPNQNFDIILFGDRVAKFSKRAVAPTPENKACAISFIQEDHNIGGGTNLNAGIIAALEMNPDAIVVLTDGQANDDDEVILSQVKYLKKKLCPEVQIYAIGFFLKPNTHPDRFLARLTSENGGKYLRWSREMEVASIMQPQHQSSAR